MPSVLKPVISMVVILATTPAWADQFQLASAWHPGVRMTSERSADGPTGDVASPTWVSGDWITEPAPPQYGAGAVLIRNGWRNNSYLTYVHELRAKRDSEGEVTNLQTIGRISAPTSRSEELLSDGQAWIIEPVIPGVSMRIRTAHKGFGMQYIMLGRTTVRRPWVLPLTENPQDGAHPGLRSIASTWLKMPTDKVNQQQCIRNLTGTVLTNKWYKTDKLQTVVAKDKLIILPPAENEAPVLTENTSLGFSSCEKSPEQLFAVVSVSGGEALTGTVGATVVGSAVLAGAAVGLPGGPVGVAAGANLAMLAAGKAMGDWAWKNKGAVFTGVPGKIAISGAFGAMSAKAE